MPRTDMLTPQQFTLAIDRPHEQRLDNFVVGENRELLTNLRSVQPEFSGFWLFGQRGSGRTHLLRASCLWAQSTGQKVAYVGCAQYLDSQGHLVAGALSTSLRQAGGPGRLVAVDDVGKLAGRRECEEALLALYQQLLDGRGRLLISHGQPATATAFHTPDLNSRMRSLMHFHLQPLQDKDKADVLRQRADSRGYALSQAVLDYWLARGPRDLEALLTDLDVLDRASLVHKQKVTIPLLKQVLGY